MKIVFIRHLNTKTVLTLIIGFSLTSFAFSILEFLWSKAPSSSNSGHRVAEYVPLKNIFFKAINFSRISKNVGLRKGSSTQHSSINLVSSSQFIGNFGLSNSFIFSKTSLQLTSSLPNGVVSDKISEHVTAKDHTAA